MKIVQYSKYGNPKDVLDLKDGIEIPEISSNQILVKMKAISINPVDWKRIQGKLKMVLWKLPYIPCEDLSGTVVQVGSNCSRLKIGDEVMAKPPVSEGGAFAEYIAIDEKFATLKPSSWTFEEAASLPLVGLTSYQALVVTARIKSGEKVLILGGSSGTGSIGIQIAKKFGAYVITTCSERNFEFVKGLGADEVIDYTKENWGEKLAGQNLDIVYDCVGGGWDLAQGVLAPNARFVEIAKDSNTSVNIPNVLGEAFSILSRKVTSFLHSHSYHFLLTYENLEELEQLRKLAEEGSIKPTVDKVFTFEQFVEAFEYQMTGRTRGKIVVTVA